MADPEPASSCWRYRHSTPDVPGLAMELPRWLIVPATSSFEFEVKDGTTHCLGCARCLMCGGKFAGCLKCEGQGVEHQRDRAAPRCIRQGLTCALALEQRRVVRALSGLPSPAEEEEDDGAASDAYSSGSSKSDVTRTVSSTATATKRTRSRAVVGELYP